MPRTGAVDVRAAQTELKQAEQQLEQLHAVRGGGRQRGGLGGKACHGGL